MPKVLAENEPLSEEDLAALGPKPDYSNVVELTDEIEASLYDAQENLIRAEHGDEAADTANYGWAVDDGVVATKVYLPTGAMVLCSELGKDGVIKHQWLKY